MAAAASKIKLNIEINIRLLLIGNSRFLCVKAVKLIVCLQILTFTVLTLMSISAIIPEY